MILLFGGTSDTAGAAETMADAGYRVLVSTATEAALACGNRPGITRRHGRLDMSQMCELIVAEQIRALVDASHPYASALHTTVAAAAKLTEIPYLRLNRPSSNVGLPPAARDHDEAAALAFAVGRPVLLTTGSRNLLPYMLESRRSGIPLLARVLDHPDSHQACQAAGMRRDQIIVGRGPFSVAANRALIRCHGIGVIVTKDSGRAGGVDEKLAAAQQEGCQVVLVGRPANSPIGYASMSDLLHDLDAQLSSVPVLALDLESVLVPEIWLAVAEATGLSELAMTTRDIPDYAELMRLRIDRCRTHGITLPIIQNIVATLEPLAGAAEFLMAARKHADMIVISDTFIELVRPLLHKLGDPALFCNKLETDAQSFISTWTMRPGGKRAGVVNLRRRGRVVIAAGDSFNDLPMLEVANAGYLFRPAPKLCDRGAPFPVVWSYDELFTRCFACSIDSSVDTISKMQLTHQS